MRADKEIIEQIAKMEVKKVDIKKLKPHPKNPRVHPESAIKKLERSIKEFGWTNPNHKKCIAIQQ